MKTRRPTVITFAIILLILASLLNGIANVLPDSNPDAAPLFVEYGILVLAVLGLVASFGLFLRRRRGMLLAFGVSVLDACLWIGGIPSDSSLITGYSILLVVVNALSIALLLLPFVRLPNATERMREVS